MLTNKLNIMIIFLVATIALTLLTGCGSSSGGGGLMSLLLGSIKQQVGTPVPSLSGGTYSEDISITITSPTTDALIYYTTDGNNPDTSSTLYIAPIPVSGNGTIMTIKAIAVYNEMMDSEILTAVYTIDYDQVSTPQFDPIAGTYDHDISVTISSVTDGAQIYYTINGDDPTTSSSPYTTGIPVADHGTNLTIRAIAVKAGMEDSTIQDSEYTITYPTAATPGFNPTAGTYDHDISVEITCADTGATIYYTTNGTPPTTSSNVYSTGIPVTGHGTTMTINAIAVKDGMVQSEMVTAEYIINYATVSTPNFNIDTGTYDQDINISISCSTPGATIYYTTNGSDPDTSSAVYTSAIPVQGHGTVMTIKAFATKSGMLDSSIVSKSYTIEYQPAASPTFSTSAGANTLYLFKGEFIYLSCSTSGATIYYTTDGNDPTTSSTQYVSSITTTGLDESTTIKAIAVKTGKLNSAIATRGYTIEQRNIYITGGTYYTKNLNGYWPLDVWSTSSAQSNRIIVSGTDVYTAGYDWNGANRKACYWKHISKTILAHTGNAEANAIAISGSTVYTAGVNGNAACYWIDTTQNPIATSFKSKGNGIALSGTDVYVAGWNQNLSANQIACYWINGTKYDLDVPVLATTSEATDIIISGGNVYIAGHYYNGNYCTCYWVNGVRTDLGTQNAFSTEMAVSGTDVYVAGESSSYACYWKNSVMTDLDRDLAEGISVVGSDVYVVESWESFGNYYIMLTKNGTEVRYLQASNNKKPQSIFVLP